MNEFDKWFKEKTEDLPFHLVMLIRMIMNSASAGVILGLGGVLFAWTIGASLTTGFIAGFLLAIVVGLYIYITTVLKWKFMK